MNATGLEVTTRFFKLAFLLFFCTPRIEIDGVPNRRPWGTHFFPLSPGRHAITLYVKCFFMRCAANSVAVTVRDGFVSRIDYFVPPWIFAKGSIRELAPTQVADPGAGGSLAAAGPIQRKCPRCAETIKLEARSCRWCGYQFDEAEVAQAIEEARPMKQYDWLHYALCLVLIPWGYLSLLFKRRNCRNCGRAFPLAV